MSSSHLKAVIFDLGGVVVRSPFIAIADYEREKGLPPNYINCSISARGSDGAWQKWERGEIGLFNFYTAFGQDLSDVVNGNLWYTEYCRRKGIECPELPTSLEIDGRVLFGRMMRESQALEEAVVKAIRRIRDPFAESAKFRVIALTNNFSHNQTEIPQSEKEYLGWHNGAIPMSVRTLFDDLYDSSALGLRKPDAAFYLEACKRSGIKPTEAVFLDDIGLNLRVARNLGMETIHVPIGGSIGALRTLQEKLGIDLGLGDRPPDASKL